MSSKKILSISVAAYNVEATLDECLGHFERCKRLKDIEILIIDDGSTDSTCSIAKKYTKKYPDSFRLVSKENGGWGSTLNTGIKECRGKYFRQLDGDDYYDEENLSLFVEYLESCKSDIVVSPFCHYEDGTGAITKITLNSQIFASREDILIEEASEIYPPAMHSMTVKSSILKDNKIAITEHCFYTDVEFVIKSLNCSKTISFFELPIYYYRLGRDGQSMSIAGIRRHYKDHQKMLLNTYEYVMHNSKSEIMKTILLKRLIDATMYQYKFYFSLTHTHQHRNELREFDLNLEKVSKECYDKNYGAPIRLLRQKNFNFFLFFVLSIIKNRQDKKHEAFLYEK